MVIEPYKVKSFLRTKGIDVTHVQIASYDPSLNQVFKINTPEILYFLKVYNDHPLGYYKFKQDQIDRIQIITKYLSNSFKFIRKPIDSYYDNSLGHILLWEWQEAFEEAYTLDDITNDSLDCFYNLGKTIFGIHENLKILPTVDVSQLYFKPLQVKIQDIVNEPHTGLFSNLPCKSFKHIKSLMQRWLDELPKYDLQQLSTTWLHSDFHPRNFRFKGNEVSNIIDWDLTRYDFAILDVLGLLGYLVRINIDVSRQFYKGYFNNINNHKIDTKLIKFILIGNYLVRSTYVISGGVWIDDTEKMEYKLFGNDKLAYQFLVSEANRRS